MSSVLGDCCELAAVPRGTSGGTRAPGSVGAGSGERGQVRFGEGGDGARWVRFSGERPSLGTKVNGQCRQGVRTSSLWSRWFSLRRCNLGLIVRRWISKSNIPEGLGLAWRRDERNKSVGAGEGWEVRGEEHIRLLRCFAVLKLGVAMLELNCSAGFRWWVSEGNKCFCLRSFGNLPGRR